MAVASTIIRLSPPANLLLTGRLARKPARFAEVALANKIARVDSALLIRNEPYSPRFAVRDERTFELARHAI